ncbi:MAG: type II secretion system F family protein [Planctomycetota bacterium]
MPDPWLLALLVVGLAVLLVGARRTYARRRALSRLARPVDAIEHEIEEEFDDVEGSLVDRRRWPMWVASIGSFLVALLWIQLGTPVSFALAVFVGVLVWRLEERRVEKLILKLEGQLADGIDLIVGSVRSGGTIVDAMSHASERVAEPVGAELREIVDRLRLGQSPREVLQAFRDRVPLDSFRLFTFTIGTNWEGGAGHAHALSSVGRAVRDRVALRRRLRTQTVETEVSVLGVLLLTYGLGYVVAHSSAVDFVSFARSSLGQFVVASILVLQAVGILWVQRLAAIRV